MCTPETSDDGMMIMMIVLHVLLFCMFAASMHDASYALVEKKCSITLDRHIYPVSYDGNPRSNPDNSLYPGDAFHYVLKYSGSSTCQGFQVGSLESNGAIDVLSHHIIDNHGSMSEHSHSDSSPVARYLTTTHYYLDRVHYKSDGITIVRSDVPALSAREDDVEKSRKGSKLLEASGTSKMSSLRIERTQDWGLTNQDVSHAHAAEHDFHAKYQEKLSDLKREIDALSNKSGYPDADSPSSASYDRMEVLRNEYEGMLSLDDDDDLDEKIRKTIKNHFKEDIESIMSFSDIVARQCSSTEKNHGCVFGHAELRPDAAGEICLKDEMRILFEDDWDFEDIPGLDSFEDFDEMDDECLESHNNLSLNVSGYEQVIRTDKYGTRTLQNVLVSRTVAAYPDIMSADVDTVFENPVIFDEKGFSSVNQDSTYYVWDYPSVLVRPELEFRDVRAGVLTFNVTRMDTPLTEKFTQSCDDSFCKITAKSDGMSDTVIDTVNGDNVDVFFVESSRHLGNNDMSYRIQLYNLDEKIRDITASTRLFVACYDPVIDRIRMWSYLNDAQNSSFENRVSIGVKYSGSIGGCADEQVEIYPDRRLRISDVASAFVQKNHFGTYADVSIHDPVLSDASSITDMRIRDSVHDMVGSYGIAESFEGPLMSHKTEIGELQIESAGFFRMLFDVDFDAKPLSDNYVDVTSHNFIITDDFGGVRSKYAGTALFEYPWGFFSTPFNMTAYKYDDESCTDDEYCNAVVDKDVTIHGIEFSDDMNYESISLVEFYLNLHLNRLRDDAEFAFMHLADLYDMNVPQKADSYTKQFQLNKTAVYYDKKLQDYMFDNYYDDTYSSHRDYMLDLPQREFSEGMMSVNAQISASRDGNEMTVDVPFYDLYMRHPIDYPINMYQDNVLDIKRATTAVSIPHYANFGSVEKVYVDDTLAKNTSCDAGCIVVLPDDSPVDMVAQNQWGGMIRKQSLESKLPDTVDVDSWTDLFGLRLLWIVSGIGLLYVGYRAVRMIFAKKRR